MKATFCFWIFLVLLIQTPIGLADLELKTDTEGDVFGYELRESFSDELIYWLPSSYQPDEISSREFAIRETTSVKVTWNVNRSAVGVEESNHRFIGNVWVLIRNSDSSGFENFLTDRLKAKIETETNLNWERHRYIFEKWLEPNVFVLTLSGKHWTDSEKKNLEGAAFEIRLNIVESDAIVRIERL